jgi:hypothetical protein
MTFERNDTQPDIGKFGNKWARERPDSSRVNEPGNKVNEEESECS